MAQGLHGLRALGANRVAEERFQAGRLAEWIEESQSPGAARATQVAQHGREVFANDLAQRVELRRGAARFIEGRIVIVKTSVGRKNRSWPRS